MEASHVHKSPCAGPRFLYSLVCYNPDRDDIKHGHPLLGFQHLHMRVRILNFYITIVAYSLAMVQPFYLEHHFQGRTYWNGTPESTKRNCLWSPLWCDQNFVQKADLHLFSSQSFFPPFSFLIFFFLSSLHHVMVIFPPLPSVQMSLMTWWDLPLLIPWKTHLILALPLLWKQTLTPLTPVFYLLLVLCITRWHMHVTLPDRTS